VFDIVNMTTSIQDAARQIGTHLRQYRQGVLKLTQTQMVERIEANHGLQITRQTYAQFESGSLQGRGELVYIALAEMGTLDDVLKVAEPEEALAYSWTEGIPGYESNEEEGMRP